MKYISSLNLSEDEKKLIKEAFIAAEHSVSNSGHKVGCAILCENGEIFKGATNHFCIVEPYGKFVADPDGDVTKIEFINPQDYKKYFDWGAIGDRIMRRAIEMKEKFENKP